MTWSVLLTVGQIIFAMTDTTPKLCKISWFKDSVLMTETAYAYDDYHVALQIGLEATKGDKTISVEVRCAREFETP